MASKAGKKRVSPANVPAGNEPAAPAAPAAPAEENSSSGAWRPQVETEREFNPFVNTTMAGEGEVLTPIGESAWESAPVVQPSEVATTRRTSRRGRAGRKVGRSARKTAGSGATAKASKAKARTKARAKTKVKARSKRGAAAGTRRAKSGRRNTRSRSAKRR